MAHFTTRSVQPADAMEFESYSYPPPYDFYDSAPGSARGFLDPKNRYVAIIDGGASLWGFGCLGSEAQVPGGLYDPTGSVLDLGVGMSPARVGAGHGRAFCAAIVGHGASQGTTKLQVTVADFNIRSLRIWWVLGFVEVHQFRRPESGYSFIQLVAPAA